jgi:hypothetical protein
MMKLACAVVLIPLGLAFGAGGCVGPGLEPPKASESAGDVPARPTTGFSDSGGTSAAMGAHAGSGGGSAGHAGAASQAGAAGHAAKDAGVEDDGGS